MHRRTFYLNIIRLDGSVLQIFQSHIDITNNELTGRGVNNAGYNMFVWVNGTFIANTTVHTTTTARCSTHDLPRFYTRQKSSRLRVGTTNTTLDSRMQPIAPSYDWRSATELSEQCLRTSLISLNNEHVYACMCMNR